jgi:hypothetical protein
MVLLEKSNKNMNNGKYKKNKNEKNGKKIK